jgi:hypothetical protein
MDAVPELLRTPFYADEECDTHNWKFSFTKRNVYVMISTLLSHRRVLQVDLTPLAEYKYWDI